MKSLIHLFLRLVWIPEYLEYHIDQDQVRKIILGDLDLLTNHSQKVLIQYSKKFFVTYLLRLQL